MFCRRPPADLDALRRLGELLEIELHPVLAPEFRVRQRLRALYGAHLPERYQALVDRYGGLPDAAPSLSPAQTPTMSMAAKAAFEPSEPSVENRDDESPSSDCRSTDSAPNPSVEAPALALPLDMATRMLDDADSGAEIARTTIAYAGQWLRFVALLQVEGSVVQGWLGSGPEADRVPSVRFDLQEESTFRVVVETREHYVGPLPSDQLQSQFLAQLGRPAPRMVLLIPLRLKHQTVALLYGDNAEGSVSSRLAGDLIQFAERVQAALETEALTATTPQEGREAPEHTAELAFASAIPLENLENAALADPALADPALEAPVLEDGLARPPNDAQANIRTDNAAALPNFEDGRFDAVEYRATQVAIVEDDDPNLDPEGWAPTSADNWDDWMPESSAPAAASNPLPFEADAGVGARVEDATVPDLSAEAWIRAASEVVRPRAISTDVLHRSELPDPDSVEDQPVPLTQVASGTPASSLDHLPLPILIATDDEELLELDDVVEVGGADGQANAFTGTEPNPEIVRALEQLVSFDPDQRSIAGATLARAGAAAIPMIMGRFPGVLNVDPFSPEIQLPPFAECGTLLALLERSGRESHRYVVDQIDAPDPLHRFFAIYFYGAVYVPEAMPKLIQRLHDEEPRICMLAARTLFSYRDHRDFPLVLEHLHGRLRATSLAARRHAAYLIGLFRDVTAIPDLVAILARRERNLQDVVEDALAEITKQRLGSSAKRWKNWWGKNKDRSRIEWLLDGLAARDAALRKSASDELTAVTGMDLGFDGYAPRREREEARQRWVKWWKAQQAKRAVSA